MSKNNSILFEFFFPNYIFRPVKRKILTPKTSQTDKKPKLPEKKKTKAEEE